MSQDGSLQSRLVKKYEGLEVSNELPSCLVVPLDAKTEFVGLCRMCTPLDLGYETEFVGLRRFCTAFLGHWDLMSELQV